MSKPVRPTWSEHYAYGVDRQYERRDFVKALEAYADDMDRWLAERDARILAVLRKVRKDQMHRGVMGGELAGDVNALIAELEAPQGRKG